jgi:hypothetical protein
MVLGIIQGAGHLGALWALVTSSIMLDQMEATPGATFNSSHPSRSIRWTGEAFVDDTSLWLLQMGMLLSAAAALMQVTAQQWERLLYATGGALNLAKCFWYGIEWTFTAAGEAQMTPTTMNGPNITLTAGAIPNQPALLQRISTTECQCTLGVCLAPDGNDNAEYLYRLQQARKMSHSIFELLRLEENTLALDFVQSGK